MKKYTYKVTGEYYKTWLEMKKENTMVHNGSLIGLISYNRDRLELNLNYGTYNYYSSEIKKASDMVITTPLEADNLNENYLYTPLILTGVEYDELIEISYIDRDLLKNIKEVTMNDIKNILSNNFKTEFNVTTPNLEFKEITDNVIAFSKHDEKVKNAFNLMNCDEGEALLLQMKDGTGEKVTMYIDMDDNLYEWTPIIYSENKVYLRLVDDYAVQL